MHKDLLHDIVRLSLISAIIALAVPELAWAQDSLKDTASAVTEEVGTLPGIISALSYIGGIAFMVGGALKLKQHADNPAQTPIKNGLVPIGVGGALIALPTVTGWVQESTNIEGSQVDFTGKTLNF